MITFATGDILKADVDAVVNTVNTVGVMGKGLALQFKRRYPENFTTYKHACDAGDVEVGAMFVTHTHQLTGPRLIVNFPTKKHWRGDSRLEWIQEGLRDLVRVIREENVTSIAIPPLGAGNGGLNWQEVRPLVEAALSQVSDVKVEIFEPVKGHFAVAPAAPRKLTNAPALIIALMLGYSQRRQAAEPWENARGASALEIQKLMFFASKLLPAMRLRFEQGTYGPYSDSVRVMLQDLEGSFVSGFGDGNDRVLDLQPIEVTDAGVDALKSFTPKGDNPDEFRQAVEGVLDHIFGFEGAYPIELLASVEWAVDELGTTDPERVTSFVQEWTERKGRLFTSDHIATALDRVRPYPHKELADAR